MTAEGKGQINKYGQYHITGAEEAKPPSPDKSTGLT